MAKNATEGKEFAFASFAFTICLAALILAQGLFSSLPFAGQGDSFFGASLGLWVLFAIMLVIDMGLMIKFCFGGSLGAGKSADKGEYGAGLHNQEKKGRKFD